MARGRDGVARNDQAELTMLKGRKAMPGIRPTGLVRWLSQEGCCYAKPYPEEFCKPRRRRPVWRRNLIEHDEAMTVRLSSLNQLKRALGPASLRAQCSIRQPSRVR